MCRNHSNAAAANTAHIYIYIEIKKIIEQMYTALHNSAVEKDILWRYTWRLLMETELSSRKQNILGSAIFPPLGKDAN
jgi:hypothetical protein